MTRGRRRDTTLEPTRQLQTSRAFRERRAAHIKALEEQVRTQADEIAQLRAQLNLEEGGSSLKDGGGADGHDKASGYTQQQQRYNHHASSSLSSSLSEADLPEKDGEGKKRKTMERYNDDPSTRPSASTSELSSSTTPSSPLSTCSNCESVKQQANQLMMMLTDMEQRMGPLRAAGVSLGQTIQHTPQHSHDSVSQPRSLYTAPPAATPAFASQAPPQHHSPLPPPVPAPVPVMATGGPPTPADEKCCLGIFKCDEAGRIIV
ncbi:hypothetical protein BDZ90DRAFT_15650 [Jaminaea rosea]|uniref:BZIP domain-containing protein n=1 Tax=Jaminaea rosea TaxID=1569628 RepID=A0A316UYW8_9BASI|nr:hypothetical protein BDZ90DRAFT_15650 [Jaminaea rosea]PWN30490.1 hypothetical protein BDZ90DRAFT_15650 [Jaminaea rosea]